MKKLNFLSNVSANELRVFAQLLRRDLYVLRQSILGKMLNTTIWASIVVFSNHYVMPFLGMPTSYGKFMLAGGIVAQMLFQAMSEVSVTIEDLTGDKEITYSLGLALPAWLAFFRYAVKTAIQGLFMGIFAIPVAVVVMGKDFNFPFVSIPKMILMYGIQSLFFGCFAVWVASFTKDMQAYEDVWLRVTFPFWMLGCYTYSWMILFQAMPWLAYVCLLNPFTYAMEGLRAAVLGQPNFLNYWGCVGMLVLATAWFGYRGITSMIRRLDVL